MTDTTEIKTEHLKYTKSFQHPTCGLHPDTLQCFSEHFDILPEKIRRYANAIQDSLYIDDTNIADKSKTTTAVVHSWISVLARETKILTTLEARLVTARAEWIKTHGVQEKMVYRQNEIAMNSSPELQKLENVIAIQKEVVAYLTESMKTIREFRWDVTNALAVLKLENT